MLTKQIFKKHSESDHLNRMLIDINNNAQDRGPEKISLSEPRGEKIYKYFSRSSVDVKISLRNRTRAITSAIC
jgi:hypothetical protein